MADMAATEQVDECWDVLTEAGVAEDVVPGPYMNSSADIKAFTGRHGGTICTSSNAAAALEWAFEQGAEGAVPARPAPGRNTAVRDMGLSPGRLRALQPAQAERRPDPRGAAAREG